MPRFGLDRCRMISASPSFAGCRKNGESHMGPDGLVVRTASVSGGKIEHPSAFEALFALDTRLGSVLRTTREPMIGQIRLAWWAEELARLEVAPPAAQPELIAIATHLLPLGIRGEQLATMIDGWEALLASTALSDDDLDRFARARGGTLFQLAATVLGAEDAQVAVAGEGWALADLSRNLSDAGIVPRVRQMALRRLDPAMACRWSRAGRPLGRLALTARLDLEAVGPAMRAARLLRYRATGR